MKILKLCVFIAIGCLAIETPAQQQPAGRIKSLSHIIHAVDDLDTTLAFYRDVFDINGKAQDFNNPAVPLLTDAPGVTLRLSMLRLPHGTLYELTHFKGLERRPGRARYTDPGAAGLVLYVCDIDRLLAAAKKANAEIVTTGGEPVEIATAGGNTRSIILRDPDGYFLQLIEEAPAADATGENVHRVSLAYTMQDAGETRDFYSGMMGIELTGASDFRTNASLSRLTGAPQNVEFRKLTGTLPPNNVVVEFTEFRGVPRTKFHLRVRDPGAPAIAIQVTNIEAMLAQMKGAGVNIISANGRLVDFGNGIYNVFVEDPNGVNVELFERTGAR